MRATAIIPCITYNNAPEAIDWLCKAFGFKKHQVHVDDDGLVVHAELTFGDAMIMTGSQQHKSLFGQYIKHPGEVDGYETQSPYLVVEDIDQHYHRAKNNGARMVIDLTEEEYGKNYSCYDPEGHLWSFGSYDPWTATTG